MLEIVDLEFKPLADHADVVLMVSKPSYSALIKANALLEKLSAEDPKEGQSQRLLKMIPFFESLVKDCVKKISGVKINGVEIQNGNDLINAGGPRELMDPLFIYLTGLISVSADDKKKS